MNKDVPARKGMEMKKTNNIVLYKSNDGTIQIDVQLEKETIWLDAHKMAQLFGRDRSVVLRHIHNVYKTKELQKNSTCAKIAQVASDGKICQSSRRKAKPFTYEETIALINHTAMLTNLIGG